MNIQSVSLKEYSSLRIGGTSTLIVVTSMSGLVEALQYAKNNALQVHVVAGGTNTFFADHLKGVMIIKIANKGVSFEDQEDYVLITAQAGEVWDDIVTLAVEKNVWGIENLSYIPGTVGAAPVQNIGAYGSELKNVFVSLEALDTKTFDLVTMNPEACQFGYRDSIFKHNRGRYIILSVTMRLSKKCTATLSYKPLDSLKECADLTVQMVRDVVIATRTAKLPDWREYPNAGSFFKNPIVSDSQAETLREKFKDIPLHESDEGYKIPAAWLIEHVAKMKGIKVGSLGTWPQQPLVIVNYAESSASELNAFTEEIIQKIYSETEITLEKEVNYVS